jgi:hypothetical protein
MLLTTTSNPDKYKNPQVTSYELHSAFTQYDNADLEVRLAEVENELRQERYKRLRAERGLNEIETEKRAPFVVPALFQAFLMVSEMDGQSLEGSF